MILVGVYTFFKNCSTAVITNVIIVVGRIGMSTLIYVTTIVANVVMVIVLMAKSACFVTCIGIATVTCIRCITFIITSRRCYNSFVIMSCCIYVIAYITVATVTCIRCISICGTCRSSNNSFVIMSCCIYVIIYIIVAALRTSISRVTLLGASRSSNYRAITVSKRIDLFGIRVSARTTSKCLYTLSVQVGSVVITPL